MYEGFTLGLKKKAGDLHHPIVSPPSVGEVIWVHCQLVLCVRSKRLQVLTRNKEVDSKIWSITTGNY